MQLDDARQRKPGQEQRRTRPARQVPRHRVLDSYVDAFTEGSFLDMVREAVQEQRPVLVANHNLHSLALHDRDPEFQRFYAAADHVFIDGAPVIALARLRGARLSSAHRLAVLDWIWPLFAQAEAEGWHVVHIGGAVPMLDRVRALVEERHPRLNLTLIDGYFDPDDPRENGVVLDAVKQAEPDVLLVGMGMPRQEQWLLRNLPALPPATVITVGGVLSFLGGDRPTPPRWLGPFGAEWLFRLATEPRRLWRRYLLEPLPLVPSVTREVVESVSARRTARL